MSEIKTPAQQYKEETGKDTHRFGGVPEREYVDWLESRLWEIHSTSLASPINNPFTKDEKEIMDKLIQAHNKFIELESTHPDQTRYWVDAVHKAQAVLCDRVLRRECPETFPSYKDE